MTAFAEAEGEKRHKTRTWLSVPDEPLFACAGIWRESDEWGRVYSVIVTEPSEQVRQVHDRMPVILHRDEHEAWLKASPQEAVAMCRPYDGHLHIERTDQLWTPRH